MYQFNCLPFHLSSAPWVLMKSTRLIVATLKFMGMRVIIYTDNILIMDEFRTMAKEHRAGLIFLLENLGFIIDHPKSLLVPVQEINFLGFVINSANMDFRMLGEKSGRYAWRQGNFRTQSVHPY